MPQSLQQLSTVSVEEEDRILAQRTEQVFRTMLSNPEYNLPSSREQAQAQVIGLRERARQLEARRRQPHSWELIHVLSGTKAAHNLLKWRLFRINNLPVEVLQRIFALSTYSSSFSDAAKPAVKLASVCSYWRSVAVNTAELWSVIPISTRPPFRLFDLCLKRAKVHPLVLFIDQRDPRWSGSETDHHFGPEDMRALMLSIASFQHQVRQLILMADTWAVVLAALRILRSIPPPRLLQRLEIRRTGNAYVQFLPPATPPAELSSPCRLFGGIQAPELDHVCLDGVYIDFARASFRNLRVLEMRKMPVEQMPILEEFLPVLQLSPHLANLTFDGACPRLAEPCNGNTGTYWRPVQLIHLRELTIRNLVPEYAVYLLQLFSAPGLRRLTLGKLIKEDFTSFVEKLVNRFPRVTVLTVEGLGMRNLTILAAWLRSMPFLRYLRVCRVANEFFEAFLTFMPSMPGKASKHKRSKSFVCPNLEVCEILEWSSINLAPFKKFYQGRRETLQRILVSQADLSNVKSTEKEWLTKTGIFNRIPLGSRPHLNDRYDETIR